MAHPITWRNVNAPRSNPASAIGVAISAFSSANQGAQNIVNNAQESEDRLKAALTDDALQGAYSDGELTPEDLQNLPEGVDFSAMLKQVQDSQKAQADIASSAASTRFNTARSEGLDFLNSDEQRDAAAALTKANLEDAQTRTKIAQRQETRLGSILDKEANTEKDLASIREEWNGAFRDKMLDKVEAGREDAISVIKERNPGISDADAEIEFDNDRLGLVDREMEQGLSEFVADMSRRFPNLSTEQKVSTAPFHLKQRVEDAAIELEKEVARENIVIRREQRNIAKSIANGEGKDLRALRASADGGWTIAQKKSQKLPLISKGSEIAWLNNALGGDTEIHLEDLSRAQTVLATLGKNSDAFLQVMSKPGTIKSRAFRSDKVAWDKADEDANTLAGIMRDRAAAFTNEEDPATRATDIDDIRQSAARSRADNKFKTEQNKGKNQDSSVVTGDLAGIAAEFATPTSNSATDKAIEDFNQIRSDLRSSLDTVGDITKGNNEDLVKQITRQLFVVEKGREHAANRANLDRVAKVSPAGRVKAAERTKELLDKLLGLDLQQKRDENEQSRNDVLSERLKQSLGS